MKELQVSSLQDIPEWFRTNDNSLLWFTRMVQRDLNLEGFFSNRYIVITERPFEEPPNRLDFLTIQNEEQLKELTRDCLFGEEELILIRDQQNEVFLKPAVDIRFEEEVEQR